MEKTYEVLVVRTGYSKAAFRIKAHSPEEAEEQAIEEAYNHVFSNEYDSYYSAEDVTEISAKGGSDGK